VSTIIFRTKRQWEHRSGSVTHSRIAKVNLIIKITILHIFTLIGTKFYAEFGRACVTYSYQESTLPVVRISDRSALLICLNFTQEQLRGL